MSFRWNGPEHRRQDLVLFVRASRKGPTDNRSCDAVDTGMPWDLDWRLLQAHVGVAAFSVDALSPAGACDVADSRESGPDMTLDRYVLSARRSNALA